MKTYCGNNRPYTYVSFPEGKKEQVISVLEKLTASEEGKKLSFWYTEGELGKKEKKRLEAASSLLIFAGKDSLSDERFKQTVDTATNYGKPVLCVHLEELAYDTPWAQMQLSPQQAIGRSAYTDEDSLAEKLSGAEIFRNMRVTKEQRRNKRGQMAGLISVPVALALCVLGYLFMATDVFIQHGPVPIVTGDTEPVIEIPEIGISGTQAELDKITELCIIGNRKSQERPIRDSVCIMGRSSDYSTGFVYPRQITEDNVLDLGGAAIRRGEISDLSWLRYMPNLRTLVLDGQRISDISPIFELKNLYYLTMRCNYIESLEGIEALEKLETVDFSYNKLTDVSSLFKCPNLMDVILAYNFDLTDLGCDHATNISCFDISFTKVEKVPQLTIGNLWFTATQTPVSDFSFLRESKEIHFVCLSGRVKSTLLPALKDKKVRELVWEDADIESMQELAETGAVFYGPGVLTVNRSDLKSLEGIENINGTIKRLTLFENKHLNDLSPVEKLDRLVTLGYDSRLESKRFNITRYCEKNGVKAVSSSSYDTYSIWENLYYPPA